MLDQLTMKEELLDKIKYKEMAKLAVSLPYAEKTAIVARDEIPNAVYDCINSFIKYGAVPDFVLPEKSSIDEVIKTVIKLTYDMNERYLYFKHEDIYWKYWIKFYTNDLPGFIRYILSNKMVELILVDTEFKRIFYLSLEENDLWLFNRKFENC